MAALTSKTRSSILSHFPAGVNKRFFGALRVYPEERVYEGLGQDEQVVLKIHLHWITLITPIAIGIAILVLPILLLLSLFLVPFVPTLTLEYAIVLAWFLFTFVAYYFLSMFVSHAANMYIITSERILDFDANTIATKTIQEVELTSVIGVEHVSGGGLLFGGLDQGTVFVSTTGGLILEMRHTPMPSEVALVIGALAEEANLRGYRLMRAKPTTQKVPGSV